MSGQEPVKPGVLFVGTFGRAAADGSVGGQMFACRSLLNSELSARVTWHLVDTTQESFPPPPVRHRIWPAVRRLAQFSWLALTRRPRAALIFTTARPGFYEKGVMVLIASALGVRVVLAPRSGHIIDDLQGSRAMQALVPFILRAADVVVCQSRSWQKLFSGISDVSEARFHVIPNWIEPEPYSSDAGLEDESDDPEPVTFLFMGRLDEKKGVRDLIEAVRLRRDRLQESRFLICGGGDLMPDLKSRSKELGLEGQFEFCGWIAGEEKLRAFRRSDVFVLPSHREGLPNSMLEAMAAGMAVIGTSVGGIPELLGNGERGLMVSPGDVEALGEALVAMAEDSPRRLLLGQRGREFVVSHHSLGQAVRLLGRSLGLGDDLGGLGQASSL